MEYERFPCLWLRPSISNVGTYHKALADQCRFNNKPIEEIRNVSNTVFTRITATWTALVHARTTVSRRQCPAVGIVTKSQGDDFVSSSDNERTPCLNMFLGEILKKPQKSFDLKTMWIVMEEKSQYRLRRLTIENRKRQNPETGIRFRLKRDDSTGTRVT